MDGKNIMGSSVVNGLDRLVKKQLYISYDRNCYVGQDLGLQMFLGECLPFSRIRKICIYHSTLLLI